MYNVGDQVRKVGAISPPAFLLYLGFLALEKHFPDKKILLLMMGESKKTSNRINSRVILSKQEFSLIILKSEAQTPQIVNFNHERFHSEERMKDNCIERKILNFPLMNIILFVNEKIECTEKKKFQHCLMH